MYDIFPKSRVSKLREAEAAWDESVKRIRAALANDPDNQYLKNALDQLHRQRDDFIEKAYLEETKQDSLEAQLWLAERTGNIKSVLQTNIESDSGNDFYVDNAESKTAPAAQTKAVTNDLEVAAVRGQPTTQTKKTRVRGQTAITRFLCEICNEIDTNELSAEKLVRALKHRVYDSMANPNSPIKKYHGFYEGVCVEWRPGKGSKKGSWGCKAFFNFVTDYKAGRFK